MLSNINIYGWRSDSATLFTGKTCGTKRTSIESLKGRFENFSAHVYCYIEEPSVDGRLVTVDEQIFKSVI